MFEKFRNRFPLSDEKWDEYLSYFHHMRVPARTVLLREGEVSTKAFVVEKGCIRVWFNKDGNDLTMQFFLENSVVSSIESFRKNHPSPVTIESIESCELWYIHKKDAEKLIADISETPALREAFIDAIFKRTFDYMHHFFSFVKNTPLQRYQNLIQEKPQIIQRIPQHYIASYLGVSSVHLSRIKSKLAKEK